MRPGAIWAIGCGQLVNWGVLYYAFSVLLVPLELDLGAPRWLVIGAFSTGLLSSAAVSPIVGRIADRGQGPVVLQAGGLVAAGLLLAWALMPNLWVMYLVWAGLGVCMAAILYEPVFAILGRAYGDADARLRAIATITVMGGLASTAFLPGTSWLVDRIGWRGSVIVLASILGISSLVVGRSAFPAARWSPADMQLALWGRGGGAGHVRPHGLGRITSAFAISTIVNSALAANIVAALIDRRLSSSTAATIGGLFGVMQLPGRVLMTSHVFTPRPAPLLIVSFAIQITGLGLLFIENVNAAPWAGVMVFACGAGLTTLARPYLVLHLYGPERAGYINGVIARGQHLSRALGPVSAAALAGAIGYPRVFAVLAVLLVAAIALTPTRR